MADDLCLIPAGPAPNGQSDFESPPSLAPTVISVLSILTAWGTMFTAAKFFINMRRVGWIDYLSVASALISIIILGLMSTQHETFRHIWDVPACAFDSNYARIMYASSLFILIACSFAKASILLLFNKIFTVHDWMRIAIWAGLAFNFLLYWPGGVAIKTYYEVPHHGETWISSLQGRSMIPLRWWQAQSALIVFLDIYIFLLPLPAIAKLQLGVRQKLAIISVFSLALMGIGASIASLVMRVRITETSDMTWISTILFLCSAVELNIAIIVSSGPGFVKFVRSYIPNLPSFFSSRQKRGSEGAYPHSDHLERNSDRGAGGAPNPAIRMGHQYYELNETWMLRTGASTDAKDLNSVDSREVR